MNKSKIVIASSMILVMAICALHFIGCGKNPLIGAINSNIRIGIARMDSIKNESSRIAFRAHDCASADAFIVTITKISFGKNGSDTNVWTGSQEVDLATTTSLGAQFSGNVPPGKYDRIWVDTASADIKVRGSVTVNSITYYTKTNHTNYTTGPAELETMRVNDNKPTFNIVAPFPAGTASSVSEIFVLVDLSNILIYYSGTGNPPFLGLPGITTAGMYLQGVSSSVTLGLPGKKELYDITTDVGGSGIGRLTLLFNSSDDLVGGGARSLYTNNTVGNVVFPPWCCTIDGFVKNTDGTTYTLTQNAYGGPLNVNNGRIDTIWFKLLDFQRRSHSGHYQKNDGTSITSGTYTATIVP